MSSEPTYLATADGLLGALSSAHEKFARKVVYPQLKAAFEEQRRRTLGEAIDVVRARGGLAIALELEKLARNTNSQEEENVAKSKKAKWTTVPADQVPEKVKKILELKALEGKLDEMRARIEAAVEDLDKATERLDDDDVKDALEAVRAKWQTLDHMQHAEGAGSRLTSIAEDLAAARGAVLIRVEEAKKEAKKP